MCGALDQGEVELRHVDARFAEDAQGGGLACVPRDQGHFVAALNVEHVAKIRSRHVAFGQGVDEVLQLMADAAELDRDLTTSPTAWERPENFNRSPSPTRCPSSSPRGFRCLVAEEAG
jgi:hypothetical protein